METWIKKRQYHSYSIRKDGLITPVAFYLDNFNTIKNIAIIINNKITKAVGLFFVSDGSLSRVISKTL